ncbi:MAG: LamG-like jellyroll fold domain-containing protein, partial [Cyanobacteria bacterium J06638_6]
TVNGTTDNPIATLYVNGEQVGQSQGAANPTTESIITAGQGFNGQLDEIAIYNRLLAPASELQTDSDGNVTNYNPGITGEGAVTTHFASRYNLPSNFVGDGTFYAVYDATDQTWSDTTRFEPQQKFFETEPLLQRAPTYDVVSTTGLEPDTLTDLYTQISLTRPSETIQAIQVTSPDGNTTWSTSWETDQNLPLAIVQDGQLVNSASGFEKILLGITETFDLYFQGTAESSDYTVQVIFSNASTASKTVSLLPNPGTSGSIGDIISAQGDILEDEVSSLAKIDSGLTFDTSEDYVGTAMVGGNFLNGDAAIAVAAPYANGGDGAVLILAAGEDLATDNTGLVIDPSQVPTNGVLIQGIAGAQEQAGFALAIGDINDQGVDDLVIGAPAGGDRAGKVYVVFGETLTPGTTLDLNALSSNEGAVITGFSANGEAGYALAVGQLNGDSFADIVIGAPFAKRGTGEVYVVNGRSSFSSTSSPTQVFTGEQAGSQAGFSVDIVPKNSSNQSLNADAFADVVIGAPNYSQTVTFNDDFENAKAPKDAVAALLAVTAVVPDTSNITGSDEIDLTTGRAYVLLGSANGVSDSSTSFTLDGSPIFNSDAEAGYSVSGAGDINSDGFEDLVIGAPAEGKGAGMTYVVAGRDSFADTLQLAWESNLLITGPAAHAQSGAIVSDAGDFNADKADDIVIGSPNAGFSAGQAHVVFGNTSESKNPLWSDTYSTAFSLAPGTSQSIAFFNQSGSTTPDPSIGTFVLNGTNPKDAMIPARGAADVNGDGVEDLLASAQIGNQIGILFGHPWLADEGSLKIKDLKSDQGFIVETEASTNVLKLNGSKNSKMTLETYKGINGTKPRTIEAWIKVPTSATGNQSIISWGTNADGGRWTVRLNDGKLRAEVQGGSIVGSTNLLDDQWHHIAVTWENDGSPNITEAKLYVDGQLETISSSSSQTVQTGNTNNVEIGATFNTSAPFLGEMDEIRIWSEARTEAEIQASLNTTFSSGEPNLKAYFTFDDGTPGDASGNDHNGTLAAGASIGEDNSRLAIADPSIQFLGDLNQDGYAETLVTAAANSSTIVFGASTQELLDGGLATRELTLTHNGAPQYAAVGDVNGDGFQDLVAVLADSSELALLLGSAELATQGTLALDGLTTKALTDTVNNILPALDINGDGLNDWVTTGDGGRNLYLGQADGTIAAPISLKHPVETAVNDVNQDGFSDLVGINSNTEPVITFGVSDFSSNQSSVTLDALPETANDYTFTNAGDVNGDGRGDFAISLADKGTVILAVSKGTGETPSYSYLQFLDGSADTLQVSTGGDINGDGLDDLVMGQPTATVTFDDKEIADSGEVFVVFGNTQLQEISSTFEWIGSSGYSVILSFAGTDTNGDGILSGRGTENKFEDGITNEVTSWNMAVLQAGELLATYDLDDALGRSGFLFNYQLSTEEILATKTNVDVKNAS